MDDEALAAELRSLLKCAHAQQLFYWLGLLVGFMPAWRYRIEQAGIAAGRSWFDRLFDNSTGFEFVLLMICVLLATSGAREAVGQLRPAWFPSLDSAVGHVADKFAEVLVTMGAFLLGVGTMSLVYSVATATATGALLTLLIVVSEFFLFGIWLTCLTVARRNKPFRGTWAGIALLASGLGIFTWFLIQGI